ncbi:MAG: PAS domain-containing protein, partial [Bacteroidetes bacterium]
MNEVELLKKALLREKAARKEAERILEQKALELYHINKQLAETNALLEKRVQERTEELNENASRLSALIGNLQSAVLVEDETRHIILVNNRFCELFGIPAPPEALTGMDCSTSAEQSKHLFVEPEKFVNSINNTLLQKKTVLAEPMQMLNGKKLERDYIPIYLDDNYVGHLWNYVDVTERTRLTEELEFVARFPEENPSPIMRFDVNSKLLYQNSAAKELISQFSVENLEVIKTGIGQTLYSNEKHKIELQLGNHYYTVTITPFIDKKYVNLYFNDVTERKRFQAELDNQKKFYEAILNRIPTDIAVFDSKHRYLFINPVAVRDQHIREWLIGKDDFEYCAYRNKDIELAKTRRAKFIKAVSNKEGMEWEDKVKDAQQNEAYIYRRMFPVFNETDELQFVIGFGIDITKVKQAEMRAEESLKAKEIFLANMSHEIRTPINGIIGLSGLLHKTALDSSQKNYLQLIRKSADNLLFIINDILDLAKVESGKIEIEIRPFELNDICNSVIQSMQYKAEEKEIQLIYNPFSFEPKYLNGDSFRLTQILTNLLNNAIKFTNTGSVELF